MMSLSEFVSAALILSQVAFAAIPYVFNDASDALVLTTSTPSANHPTALRIVTSADNTTNCLTAGGSSNGASVSVQPCSSSDTQNTWIFPSGIPDSGASAAQNIKYGNLCLDVTGGVDATGTKLQLYTCNSGNKNQQWVVNVSGTTATLQWAGHSKCVDNTNGAHNGTQAQIWTCSSGNRNQKFTPIDASTTLPNGQPVQFGHGTDRNICLGVDALYNGSPVILTHCEPENQERNVWIHSTDNGPLTLGDFCLDATNGNTANGNKLQIWTCAENSSNQKWNLANDGTIQWVGKGKCVDLTNGNVTVGNQLQLWTCSSSNPNQHWVSLPPL